MKVGDLVRILLPPDRSRKGRKVYLSSQTGEEAVAIIIDSLEGAHGFVDYEVLVGGERCWWSDIQLEVTSDAE
tara:strand:+ start:730 stop:948 length:219 start_codon:yes stop_codon:yes gene_type:complete